MLDLIAIGRSSVDLYAGQVGTRLEDALGFSKYIGGSPTNIAAGAAKLGLRAGLITRVGEEQFGRFIIEQLRRYGVDVNGVSVDSQRLTALAILAIKNEDDFPLLFYRKNCADLALTVDEIDEDYVKSAGAVLLTGTHLSTPTTAAACMKAVEIAKKAGAKLIMDIDYRPSVWGLVSLAEGESRFVASERVTAVLAPFLPLMDLIVGTEEEMHIAGGTTDTLEALRAVRALAPAAALVCKRGERGAAFYAGDIPARLEDGLVVPGLDVEVYNVLGAGDGFMAGMLRGWLKNEDWETSLRWGNACGALAVSRHGCAPAYPSWEELQWFLERGSKERALRKDALLEHVHWATNRRRPLEQVLTLAFDHRVQLEAIADRAGAPHERIGAFKRLCLRAARAVSQDRPGYGILCDAIYGRGALFDAVGSNLWIARPVEVPGSCPVRFQVGPDLGSELATWPAEHVAKILCRFHPDDPDELWENQLASLAVVQDAARATEHEMLLEVVVNRKRGEHGPLTTAEIMERVYGRGIRPDWWKLEPLADDAGWAAISDTIARHDRWCQGIVVLGMEAPVAELKASFEVAARHPYVKGFAVGRTIFAAVALDWFGNKITDDEAVAAMKNNFAQLCGIWAEARAAAG